jgi:hypothetical protein
MLGVESPVIGSADSLVPSGTGGLVADHLARPLQVEEADFLNGALILDAELVNVSVLPDPAAADEEAMALAEAAQPAGDAPAIDHPERFDEGAAALQDEYVFPSPGQTQDQVASSATIRALGPFLAGASHRVPGDVEVAHGPSTDPFGTALVGSATESVGESSLQGGAERVSVLSRIDGAAVGSLPLQVASDALVSVRLADLISLFEDRMERPLFVWLKSSSSANEYVTFETLKAAGIEAEYDAEAKQVTLSIADARTP